MPGSREVLLLSILFLGITFTAGGLQSVNAAGEGFTLSSLPARTNEGNSSGITLTLSVTNAVNPGSYSFTWTVTDPSGSSTSTTKPVVSTASAWTVAAKYPSDFSASLNLVGTYSVNVAENAPSVNSSISTVHFTIGLTDYTSYRRTSTVHVEASGYLPADNVTINIIQGASSAPGYPTKKNADPTGAVQFSWQTAVDSTLGNYTVILTGKNTIPKNPPDTQQVILYPTNVTLTSLWTNTTAVQRTETVEFRFNATYFNGLRASTGSAQLRLTEPDGTTSHLVSATFAPSLNTYRATYSTGLAYPQGTWTATVAVASFADAFGNGGPSTMQRASFNVQPATLMVSLQSSSGTFGPGSIIPLYARVTVPGNSNFTQGTVSAVLTISGRHVAGPLSLVYDQSLGKWSGSYKVNSADPTGTWLATVSASDSYGNTGQGTVSFNIDTPGSQSQDGGWIVWLLVLVMVGLGCGILILRRRGVIHREVKLDIQAIKQKADEVKGDDFLQSIQAQLKRRAERMAAEKEKHD